MRVLPESRRVTGFARVGDRVLISFLTAGGSVLALYSAERLEAEAVLPHHYYVHDVLGDRVLIGVSSPEPMVFWLDVDTLIGALLQGATSQ
jgi:hypothetical protein